jgi:hypothetical protein
MRDTYGVPMPYPDYKGVKPVLIWCALFAIIGAPVQKITNTDKGWVWVVIAGLWLVITYKVSDKY